MNRAQLLWLQTVMAAAGAYFWLTPPLLPHAQVVVGLSLGWGGLCFVSIFWDKLENWSHRLSAFVSFLLATIEGSLGLIGFAGKSELLWLGLVHGVAFLLSVIGRYQYHARQRPRSALRELAYQLESKGPD